MDIIDILDKMVKDTVEAKLRLEEELVNELFTFDLEIYPDIVVIDFR